MRHGVYMLSYWLNASFDACEHLESPAGMRSLGQARRRRRLLGSRRCRWRRDARGHWAWRRHASPIAIRLAEYWAVPGRAVAATATHHQQYRLQSRHRHFNSPHHVEILPTQTDRRGCLDTVICFDFASKTWMRKVSAAYNTYGSERRIFGMNKWESVKLIQYFCGRLDFSRIFHLHNLQFITRISTCDSGSVMKERVLITICCHTSSVICQVGLCMLSIVQRSCHLVLLEMLFLISLLVFTAVICDGGLVTLCWCLLYFIVNLQLFVVCPCLSLFLLVCTVCLCGE